jgi:hypothetical protein
MKLHVVGAGLPRTGTSSLRVALEKLLGGRCCHMSALDGHPFKLGEHWDRALRGQPADWDVIMRDYNAAVDWPASAFWRELSFANPDALVLLSVRDSARTWWESMNATVLPNARMGLSADWKEGDHLNLLFERFAGTKQWDARELLIDCYERHNAEVRRAIPSERLLEWRATDGWEPICNRLDLPVPNEPFPWTNRREDWG